MSTLLQTCLAFIKISLFSFGGGYAAVGLVQDEIVRKLGLITMDEYIDMVAIAEMTPGPIAVNTATFVGNRIAGVPGGILCTLSIILCPVIISLIVVLLFEKFKSNKYVMTAVRGIRPVAIAIIAAAALSIGESSFTDIYSIIIAAIAALVIFVWKKGPIYAILISGCLGILFYGFILV